jgi:predicted Zn-dependent protease
MKQVVLAGAIVLAVASAASAQLGSIGSGLLRAKQVTDIKISDDEEVEIGKLVSERIRQRYGVVQDKAVHRYVGLVGYAVATSTARPNLPWQFIVLDTDGVNAFAAPGGFVHITKGALALMKSEAELADVLGHEVIHVTERHTIKAIQKGKMKDLGLDVAPGGGLSQLALSKLADAATEAVLAGFGRTEELESDDKGIVLANKVGYDPMGLGAFLTRLKERNSGNTSDKRGLFASHPEMDERLKRLDSTITANKLTATATLEDRFKKTITYVPKPQTEIAQVEAGAAGLAGGSSAKPAGKSGEKKEGEAPPEEKKKGRFGLGRLMPFGGGEEKKSAQVTGSGAGRGVDTERNAKGGDNPALVAITITPKDLEAFKREGKLD